MAVTVVVLIGWYAFFGPRCAHQLRLSVISAADGTAHCLAARMPKGGYAVPERCFRTRDEADSQLARIRSVDDDQFKACQLRLEDHFALGPVKRFFKGLVE